VLDDGTAISETLLIIHYLERRKPDPSLLPSARLYKELSLAGKAMGLVDAAFWIVFNRRFGGKNADEGNTLEERRINAIKRTLEELKKNPPHAVKGLPGLGQLALEVALEYIEFRLPEFNAFESGHLTQWSKPLRQMEAFHLTEFH
jgi:glutathione S-transferase